MLISNQSTKLFHNRTLSRTGLVHENFTISEAVVISVKTTNRSVTGLWTTLAQNGQTINSGGTHIAFDVNNNQQYTVTATDYGSNFFDHWQDTGSTSRSRTFSINQDTPFVAVYR